MSVSSQIPVDFWFWPVHTCSSEVAFEYFLVYGSQYETFLPRYTYSHLLAPYGRLFSDWQVIPNYYFCELFRLFQKIIY